MNQIPDASGWVRLGIPVLAVFVAGLVVVGARVSVRTSPEAARRTTVQRTVVGLCVLFAVTGGVAGTGVLANEGLRPPVMMPLMLACLGGTVAAALSPFGRRLARNVPLSALVLAQGFRLPLELVMRAAAREGVMPVEMSFAGYNFDILTGAAALVVAALVQWGRAPRRLVVLWNVTGSLLLANVVGIAIAASPAFAAFGESHLNEWVLHFPYVWLPTVLVPAALFGHLLVFRRLSRSVSELKAGHEHAF